MDEYVSEDGTFALEVNDEGAVSFEELDPVHVTGRRYVRVPNPNDPDE